MPDLGNNNRISGIKRGCLCVWGGGCSPERPPEGNVRGPFTRNETKDVTSATKEPVSPSSLRGLYAMLWWGLNVAGDSMSQGLNVQGLNVAAGGSMSQDSMSRGSMSRGSMS